MSFGERLREARRANGYTQRELADRIGSYPGKISDYERDETDPSLETLVELVEVLGVTADQLLFGDVEARADARLEGTDLLEAFLEARRLSPTDQAFVRRIVTALAIAEQAERLAG